jgi:photosystem II stability/assembly factor-like uncharacterized protein
MTGPCRLMWLWMISLSASGADTPACWLHDAARPTSSVTFALCEQGAVLATTDGGATWTAHPTGATNMLRAISFVDANRGLVAGDGGLLLATTDGGKTWQPRKTGTTENLVAIQTIGDSGWISGYDGIILHSADGERTWTRQESGVTQALEGLYFLDAEHGWAVGWAGTVLRTLDGGKTWHAIKTDAASWSLSAVYFRDPQNGWIAGFGGQLLHSTDGGLTWEVRTTPSKGWHTSVLFDQSNHGWITADGGLLFSEDGGSHWQPIQIDQAVFADRLISGTGPLLVIGPFGMMQQKGAGLEFKKVANPFVGEPETR